VSQIKALAEAVAAAITAAGTGATPELPDVFQSPAVALWTPELDKQDLEGAGTICQVLPFAHAPDFATRRGGSRLGESTVELHLASIRAQSRTTTEATQLADGDAAVDAAERLLEWLLGRPIIAGWRCVAADHDPVISRDFAREYRIWVSYLKTTWKRGI
jgi:hypothetical protein